MRTALRASGIRVVVRRKMTKTVVSLGQREQGACELKQFLSKRWFLLCLILVFIIGLMYHQDLQWVVTQESARDSIVFAVLFLMTVSLSLHALSSGVRRSTGTLLAVALNYGILPVVTWGVACLIPDTGLAGLRGGLLVVAVTPCTLVSAAVWTRRAGGNDSIAILVTLITNLLCFVIAPLWLLLFFGSGTEFNLTLSDMVSKLGLLVVLPMVVAQASRLYRPWAKWATAHKTELGIIAQCGILSIVFLGAVQVAPKLLETPGSDGFKLMGIAIGAVLVIHTTVFWLGISTGRLLQLPREDYLAVGFAGSQKTLMVGLVICVELGVLLIPMVLYHVAQLFVDTLFADYFRQRGQRDPELSADK